MSCILRVSGSDLDIESLLTNCQMQVDRVWHRGDLRAPGAANGKCYGHSGVTFVVSEAGFDDFNQQMSESTTFLEKHLDELSRIITTTGVDHAVLDFGIDLRDAPIHSDILGPRFLRAVADAGVTVELSHYPCRDRP